ncbi:MAG: hypothetical protein WD602_02395, partial [Actinomycetota bacterium]
IEGLVTGVLPPGWTLRSRRTLPDGSADAEWELRSPDGQSAIFAVESKRELLGRQIDDMIARLSQRPALPLAAAPFLSPTIRGALADRGISYADSTGNLRLVADRPGIFVERQGAAKNPWPADDTLQSLRGRAAGRAVRALVDFRPPYGVRDLAKRASVPLGSLSRTLSLLDRDGLVTRGDRGDVVDLDWERVLRRWTQDYEFARTNRLEYYLEPRGLPAVEQQLAKGEWLYAVTGASAAQRFAPIAPARQIAVYVQDVGRSGEALRLRPADPGANVVLVEPFDPVVFERTTTRDRTTVVAASQLAADLLSGRGREPSEGIELLGWMRLNEDQWRA